MIQDTLSRRQRPSLTSDRWHVVRAAWDGGSTTRPMFDRAIVSEHDDRDAARVAAKELESTLASAMAKRTPRSRDQVFVRRPDFKSLKHAPHMRKRL